MPTSIADQERMLAHLKGQEALSVVKVRAGFYRVGVYCIHKGHRWCVYHNERLLPDAHFRSLQEATWWAQTNQPRECA